MPHKILQEDWSDYDDRKKRNADARFFACTETWEQEYLIKKIRRVYPQYSEVSIKAAILLCCREVKPPHPRKEFVECVMRRLRN